MRTSRHFGLGLSEPPNGDEPADESGRSTAIDVQQNEEAEGNKTVIFAGAGACLGAFIGYTLNDEPFVGGAAGLWVGALIVNREEVAASWKNRRADVEEHPVIDLCILATGVTLLLIGLYSGTVWVTVTGAVVIAFHLLLHDEQALAFVTRNRQTIGTASMILGIGTLVPLLPGALRYVVQPRGRLDSASPVLLAVAAMMIAGGYFLRQVRPR